MIKLLRIFLSYILILFNSNLIAEENSNQLRIGLLAPFSGDYRNLGESLLLSTQLALDEINDKNLKIIPRDSGSDDKEQLNIAIKEIIEAGAKIIIGPTDFSLNSELNKYKDIIFISLSNRQPKINFIQKQKKKKTVIMYPKNEYESFIDKKINSSQLKNFKVFKYSSDPKVLTGEIEKLTNYRERKRNLEIRKKMLKEKDDEKSKREFNKLDQLYTLGKVKFDSVIVIDFGNNLKSVLTSLAFSDVDDKDVLFTTVNQWFDESLFYGNTVKNLYFPSVNQKQFKKYNDNYFKVFKLRPNEITILAYDALGLIYYVWKKNGGIKSVNDFFIKEKIKGKIGTFQFKDNKVTQELNIYKTSEKKFIKQ